MKRIWAFTGLMACIVALAQGTDPARRPVDGDLKEGAKAPTFTLRNLQTGKPEDLKTLNDKPLVLIFGSCT
jgi:cytochrome oxidase Cu insertion factor (SCO1/SenC/PrrC family)